MACDSQFRPGIEWSCIKELISLIRSGQIKTRSIEAGKMASWILGCALDQFDGQQPVLFSAAEVPETLDGCCAWILASEPESGQVMTLSPAVMAILMQLIRLLLQELLS